MTRHLVNDYAAIKQRLLEINAGSTNAVGVITTPTEATAGNPRTKPGRGGFDVVCDQPVPEDHGVTDGGGGHIAIVRFRRR